MEQVTSGSPFGRGELRKDWNVVTEGVFKSDLEYSSLDSDRFTMRVFRARNSSLDDALALAIAENECDVAIVRTSAGIGQSSPAFEGVGFPVQHADTLVYYECDPGQVESKPPRNNDIGIRLATQEDRGSLLTLVERAFAEYPGHYATNELFDPDLVLAGYAQWATDFIDRPGREVLLADDNGRDVGFLTFETRNDLIEIVLNGVDPDWEGRGVYGDLLRTVLGRGRKYGVRRIEVSTQVNNYAVQRAWQREGFRLRNAFQTFHINSMLHAGDEVVALRLQVGDGSSDLNVQTVLSALDVQAPNLSAVLSRIEVTQLVPNVARGEYGVVVRLHVTSSGIRRYSGVIRDLGGRAVGVLRADSSSSEWKQTKS